MWEKCYKLNPIIVCIQSILLVKNTLYTFVLRHVVADDQMQRPAGTGGGNLFIARDTATETGGNGREIQAGESRQENPGRKRQTDWGTERMDN